jgi:hypothetical protein
MATNGRCSRFRHAAERSPTVASKPPTYAGQRNRAVARPAFPKERNIAGQLEALRALQQYPVFPSPCEHPGILLPAALSRFMHDARHVFARVHFAAFPAPTQIKRNRLYACFELGLVVEGCDDLVSALVPVQVVPVVPHDVAGNLVVLWIDGRHDARIRRPRCRTSRRALLHQSSRLTTCTAANCPSHPVAACRPDAAAIPARHQRPEFRLNRQPSQTPVALT